MDGDTAASPVLKGQRTRSDDERELVAIIREQVETCIAQVFMDIPNEVTADVVAANLCASYGPVGSLLDDMFRVFDWYDEVYGQSGLERLTQLSPSTPDNTDSPVAS